MNMEMDMDESLIPMANISTFLNEGPEKEKSLQIQLIADMIKDKSKF